MVKRKGTKTTQKTEDGATLTPSKKKQKNKQQQKTGGNTREKGGEYFQ
jgi:hypothetical protein